MSFGKVIQKVCLQSALLGFFSVVFGVVLAMTAWLYLKHMIGGKTVAVPDLLGYSAVEAEQLLSQNGLVLSLDQGQKVFSNVIPKDRVYLQIPRPGRKIKVGRSVEITISAGPEEKKIPELAGETLSFSTTLLKDVGRRPDLLSRVHSHRMPKGRVLAQNPKGGAPPKLKQKMALLVSDGPQLREYVTPEFIGKDYEDVKRFLDRHKFRIITKYRAEDDGLGPVILQQTPLPGFPLTKAQTITLIVNKDF